MIKRVFCVLIVLVLICNLAYASTKESISMTALFQSEKAFGVSVQEKPGANSEMMFDTMGKLVISADEITHISEPELETYIVKSGYSVQISYESIKDLTKPAELNRWSLDDERTSKIGEYDWKKGIGKGGILIQKSFDRESWETVYSDMNVFKEYSPSLQNFFSASRSDLSQGCYYRIVIAYKKSIKTKDSSFYGLWDTSEYHRVYCVEEYDVYLVSDDVAESVTVSAEMLNDSDLGELASLYGSGAIAGASIGNQVAGQEILVTSPAHAGYGGEFANIVDETIHSVGTGNTVIHTGENNAPNGPDYIIKPEVGEAIQIQTKYYPSASQTIGACFDENGMFRYNIETGKPMQIEVPKEQYDKAITLMKDRIISGKVEGITDPAKAEEIIRQGSVTYKQAANIAKAGNIDSLLYDAKTGIVTATVAMGVSSVIQFATCIWNHKDVETALKASVITGVKTLGNTLIIGVLSKQIGRTGLQALLKPGSEWVVKTIGPKASAVIINAARVGLKPIYGATAM